MDVRSIGRIGRLVSPIPPPLVPIFRGLRPLVRPRYDANFGGNLKIVGTTKVKGAPDSPVRRRVSLHDQSTGLLVRSQWSDAVTGAYLFDLIKPGVYYVVSFDHTGLHNGVIATGVVPELIP